MHSIRKGALLFTPLVTHLKNNLRGAEVTFIRGPSGKKSSCYYANRVYSALSALRTERGARRTGKRNIVSPLREERTPLAMDSRARKKNPILEGSPGKGTELVTARVEGSAVLKTKTISKEGRVEE